jgi:drug/metabolite transporter (DMT)-like permease
VNSSYDPADVAERVRSTPDRPTEAAGSLDVHRHPLLGVTLVFAAAALFAVNGTVSKLVLTNGLSSLRLVEIRCVAATVLFALIAARRPASLRIGPREFGFIAVYGIVGLAMTQWLYFVSIARMPVSVSLLIEFTAPLMVALWVRFVRHEPVRGRVWVALALCLSGLILVARVWAGLTLDVIGLLTAAGAAVALAAYYMLGERGLGSRDPFSLATWSFGAAGLFWSLLLPWWSFPFDRLSGTVVVGHAGPHVLVGLLVAWVVLLGTVVPFGLVLMGLRLIGAARTGLVGTAEPVIAGLVAWFVLGERLSPVQLGGAAVVMAGILVAESARAPRLTAAAPVAEGLAP